MELSFLEKTINKEEYKRISNYILPLIIKTSEYYKIPIEEVDSYRIYSFCCLELDYDIIYHDYGDIASKFISGRTRKIDHKISIIVNNNKTHNKGRVNFTTMHEIVHAYVHLSESVHPVFASSKTKINPDDIQSEIEADIGASLLMINDAALNKKLCESLSFNQLCNFFESSYANMHMRLRSFLCFNYEMNEKYALTLINEFRFKNNRLLVQFVKHSDLFLGLYDNSFYEFQLPETIGQCSKDLETYLHCEDIQMSKRTKELISHYAFSNLK